MGLALIVPAYNEAALVPLFEKHLLDGAVISHFDEVVLVDDGSSDNTQSAMNLLAERSPQVRVVSHRRNRGLGAAIRSGIVEASSSHVCWAPIDQSFDLQEILALAKHRDSEAVILFRRILRDEPARNLVSFLAHYLFRLLFGCDVRHQSGLFLMPRRAFIENMPITQRAISNLEFIVRLKRSGVETTIVDINCSPRVRGRSRTFSLRSILRSGRELIGLLITEPGLVRRRTQRQSQDRLSG